MRLIRMGRYAALVEKILVIGTMVAAIDIFNSGKTGEKGITTFIE